MPEAEMQSHSKDSFFDRMERMGPAPSASSLSQLHSQTHHAPRHSNTHSPASSHSHSRSASHHSHQHTPSIYHSSHPKGHHLDALSFAEKFSHASASAKPLDQVFSAQMLSKYKHHHSSDHGKNAKSSPSRYNDIILDSVPDIVTQAEQDVVRLREGEGRSTDYAAFLETKGATGSHKRTQVPLDPFSDEVAEVRVAPQFSLLQKDEKKDAGGEEKKDGESGSDSDSDSDALGNSDWTSKFRFRQQKLTRAQNAHSKKTQHKTPHTGKSHAANASHRSRSTHLPPSLISKSPQTFTAFEMATQMGGKIPPPPPSPPPIPYSNHFHRGKKPLPVAVEAEATSHSHSNSPQKSASPSTKSVKNNKTDRATSPQSSPSLLSTHSSLSSSSSSHSHARSRARNHSRRKRSKKRSSRTRNLLARLAPVLAELASESLENDDGDAFDDYLDDGNAAYSYDDDSSADNESRGRHRQKHHQPILLGRLPIDANGVTGEQKEPRQSKRRHRPSTPY